LEKNFIFIESISIYKKIFLSLLLAISIYLILFGGLFYGLIIFGISLRYLMQKGVELDLLNMKHRELSSWYGLKFGKWQALPNIKYVSIFETKKGNRVRAGGGNAAHFSTIIFKLNLFYNKNKHITLLESEDENKVFEIGNNISKILDIKFHNATKK
jgi:hypothetical protein